MNKFKVLIVLLLCSVMAMAQGESEGNSNKWETAASPNGKVVVRFGIDNGRPYYTVQYGTKDVIKKSFLGLELAKDKLPSVHRTRRQFSIFASLLTPLVS